VPPDQPVLHLVRNSGRPPSTAFRRFLVAGAATAWALLLTAYVTPILVHMPWLPDGTYTVTAALALTLSLACAYAHQRVAMRAEADRFAGMVLPVEHAFAYGAEYNSRMTAAGFNGQVPRQVAPSPTADGTETVELPRVGGDILPFQQGTRRPRPRR